MPQLSTIKIYLFYCISVILLLIKYAPYSVSSFYSYFPLIEICFIFYFYVFRTNYAVYLLIFLMTIIFDTIDNNIIGSTALIVFLTLYIFAFQKKLFWYNNFKEIWIGFTVFLIEFNIIKILIYFLVNQSYTDFQNLIYVNIITILFYPILHNIFYYLSLLLEKNHDPA